MAQKAQWALKAKDFAPIVRKFADFLGETRRRRHRYPESPYPDGQGHDGVYHEPEISRAGRLALQFDELQQKFYEFGGTSPLVGMVGGAINLASSFAGDDLHAWRKWKFASENAPVPQLAPDPPKPTAVVSQSGPSITGPPPLPPTGPPSSSPFVTAAMPAAPPVPPPLPPPVLQAPPPQPSLPIQAPSLPPEPFIPAPGEKPAPPSPSPGPPSSWSFGFGVSPSLASAAAAMPSLPPAGGAVRDQKDIPRFTWDDDPVSRKANTVLAERLPLTGTPPLMAAPSATAPDMPAGLGTLAPSLGAALGPVAASQRGDQDGQQKIVEALAKLTSTIEKLIMTMEQQNQERSDEDEAESSENRRTLWSEGWDDDRQPTFPFPGQSTSVESEIPIILRPPQQQNPAHFNLG